MRYQIPHLSVMSQAASLITHTGSKAHTTCNDTQGSGGSSAGAYEVDE